MKLFRLPYILLLLFLFAGCDHPQKEPDKALPEVLASIDEPDLIPEGTAYYPKQSLVLVGSTHKRKIIATREDGSYYDFIRSTQDSLWSPLGMEVDSARNHLWVIHAKARAVLPTQIPTTDPQWRSSVRQYNLADGKLLADYPLVPKNDSTTMLMNDLTIGKDGKVYATESVQNGIYVIDPDLQKMEPFLMPKGATFLNGLDFDDTGKRLFVSSTEGIISVNVKNKTYSFLEADSSINTKTIDGLAFKNNYLIGHQSRTVTKFYLNDDQTKIIDSERLDGDNLDSSTTGEIGGDYYYYIANYQIRSGIDYERGRIKPLNSLEVVIIKKIRL